MQRLRVLVGTAATTCALAVGSGCTDDSSSHGPPSEVAASSSPGDGATHRPAPASETSRRPVAVTRTVSLAAGGDRLFRLTWNSGCAGCASVWTRHPSGDWTRLHDFAADPRHPRQPPVDRLVVSPDGHNAWALGRRLWSTHVDRHLWGAVASGPGRPTPFARYLAVGTRTAWAVRATPAGVSLWRTRVDTDDWRRVAAPRLRDLTTFGGVTDDDRVVLLVSGEGGSDTALVVGRPGRWSATPVPFGADALVRTDGTTLWATTPEPRGLRLHHLVGGEWRDLGRFTAQNWWPLDGSHVLLDQVPPALYSASGSTPTDLRAGTRILSLARTADGTFWVLGTGDRVSASSDGRHWTLRP